MEDDIEVDINKTIRDIELWLAEHDNLREQWQEHSTPKVATTNTAHEQVEADSGFQRTRKSELDARLDMEDLTRELSPHRSPPGRKLPTIPTMGSMDSARKSVIFSEKYPTCQDADNEHLGLSKYRMRDEEKGKSLRSEPRSYDFAESGTYARYESDMPRYCGGDSGITFRKHREPKVQQKANFGHELAGRNIKPATYDGSGSWLDYKAHFEAALGGWTDAVKGLYVSVSLRGQAQGILGNLPGGHLKKYSDLVTALNERFAPPNQTELYRAHIRERRQRASETLPELGQSIRRVATQAYPRVPMEVVETLAKEQFIDALIESNMRLRIKQERPNNLNDAIRLEVELEAFVKAEQKQKESQGFIRPVAQAESIDDKSNSEALATTIEKLQKSIEHLQRDLQQLKCSQGKPKPNERQAQGNGWKQNIACHNCGRKGHFRRECQFAKEEKQGKPKPNDNHKEEVKNWC